MEIALDVGGLMVDEATEDVRVGGGGTDAPGGDVPIAGGALLSSSSAESSPSDSMPSDSIPSLTESESDASSGSASPTPSVTPAEMSERGTGRESTHRPVRSRALKEGARDGLAETESDGLTPIPAPTLTAGFVVGVGWLLLPLLDESTESTESNESRELRESSELRDSLSETSPSSDVSSSCCWRCTRCLACLSRLLIWSQAWLRRRRAGPVVLIVIDTLDIESFTRVEDSGMLKVWSSRRFLSEKKG